MKIIDPPSGWRYGFPKPIPDDVKNVNDWLIEQGYPKSIIEEMGDYFFCRYWEEPSDTLKENHIVDTNEMVEKKPKD